MHKNRRRNRRFLLYWTSMLPFLEPIEHTVEELRSTFSFELKHWPLFIGGVAVIIFSFLFFPSQVSFALSLAFFLAPLWLPVLIVMGAWHMWLLMRRSEYIAGRTWNLLEIKLPRNLVKTPLAMETVLSNIHYNKGESNWYQLYWLGQVRPWWSLEIASFGGEIHFFIWTRSDFKKLVENAFYAQYPGAQLVEAVDYTRTISAKPGEWDVWGCDYKHTKSVDAYPIKTYVEWGLDKTQKEPEQVDPFASIVEFMGSIGKNEQMWLQFIIRVHTGDKYHKKNEEGKKYTWRDQAIEEIEVIRKRAGTKSKFFDPTTGKMVETEGFPNPTKGQSETIAAIERNVSKLAFDAGGRCVYIAAPGHFNPAMITGMINLFKPFNSEGYNGIRAAHFGLDFNDYPWELNLEKRKDVMRQELVQAFRRRQYFHSPFKMPDPMVMSTEELATIYHVPSSTVATPGLRRIQSATGEAPANLPT